jgi:hypothetical protein
MESNLGKQKRKNKYQPKSAGAINWKKSKKRDDKWVDKQSNQQYEKTEYCLDSPKFTEYYKVTISIKTY